MAVQQLLYVQVALEPATCSLHVNNMGPTSGYGNPNVQTSVSLNMSVHIKSGRPKLRGLAVMVDHVTIFSTS